MITEGPFAEFTVWCPCYGTPEPEGKWIAPDDVHADTCVIDWMITTNHPVLRPQEASPGRRCSGCWIGRQQPTSSRPDGHSWTDCDHCGLPGAKPEDYTWHGERVTHYVNHGNTWQSAPEITDCCAAADWNRFHCPNHRPIDGAIYAVRHGEDWHLAEWLENEGTAGIFHVLSSQMQSGDRWRPEWVDGFVFVARVSS